MNRYQQLLAATVDHLERLGERDVRCLPVEKEILERLSRPPADRPQAPSRPPARKPEPAAASPRPAIRIPHLEGDPLPREERLAAMEALRKEALACIRCNDLVRTRQHVVFGTGNVDARLMFVGEAPGRDEDREGEPFVGRAGQLLTKAIGAMGLSRNRVYIANALKCRPNTESKRTGNRKPTKQELDACRDWLMRQIGIIRPEVMVALGKSALDGLQLKFDVGITRIRGKFLDFGGIALMPTYHPSYVLRNEYSWTIKRQFWEDLLMVMERLGMEINEKQKNYFQKNSH